MGKKVLFNNHFNVQINEHVTISSGGIRRILELEETKGHLLRGLHDDCTDILQTLGLSS